MIKGLCSKFFKLLEKLVCWVYSRKASFAMRTVPCPSSGNNEEKEEEQEQENIFFFCFTFLPPNLFVSSLNSFLLSLFPLPTVQLIMYVGLMFDDWSHLVLLFLLLEENKSRTKLWLRQDRCTKKLGDTSYFLLFLFILLLPPSLYLLFLHPISYSSPSRG